MLLTTEISTAAGGLTTRPVTPLYAEFLNARNRKLAEILLDYVVAFSIAVVGVVTNILVIAVYAKQGFRESVAVSMTTISVWDLIKCLAGVLERFSGILSAWDPAAAYTWTNIGTAVFKYIICYSSYVTSVMAAYVAVERCLCVSVPLKVKWLLTPRITLTACLVISVGVFGCFAVMFGIYDIEWEWSTTFNATVAVYRKNSFYIQHEDPLFKYYNLSGILWPLVSFVVIVIATAIITYKLKQGSKFRGSQGSSFGGTSFNKGKRPTSQKEDRCVQQNKQLQHQQQKQQQKQEEQQQNLSKRDRQVVKMLLVIVIIYVVSLSPRISLYIAKYFVDDFYFLRRLHHSFLFVCYWLWIFDFFNGAVNFFVFYKMSSSFRSTFQSMFSRSQNASSQISTSK
ncbi:chemosensory receptor C [Elysia marginata]|uniref:Chemosensory receptor C n=1 Tax=Elysia marginata TaxID=1093978 RepID=A0AAV4JKK7_9GAST|nr:chemosensory receptor C [Elysia marginata]